ncbi:hypothetical protein MN202_01145 [Rheinheimera muenzenbergensis]|uniref:Uncharacterized protein n=1 Tax=Rheinheimera muenzenbergensis TaxID=1193628 RepID=A0ABU8C1N5_9GAMM
MMLTRPVAITGIVTTLVCGLHFISAVYVPVQGEQRVLTVPEIPALAYVLPYQPEQLQNAVAQWFVPTENTAAAATQSAELLAGFDNTVLGDTTVALLAIYQQQHPAAVLALQQVGQSVKYVRLLVGESSGDIALSQISRRDITLSYNDKQVTLKLFTPASAVTE